MTAPGLGMRGASLTMPCAAVGERPASRMRRSGYTENRCTSGPRRVVVLEPGTIPKTPGKLRRATSHALLG